MVLDKLVKNNTTDCLYPYILRILRDKPKHAYVLRKEIEDRFGFKPGSVTAYRVLYNLKKLGFVEKTEEDRKKMYKLTKKGEQELNSVVDFYKKQINMLK